MPEKYNLFAQDQSKTSPLFSMEVSGASFMTLRKTVRQHVNSISNSHVMIMRRKKCFCLGSTTFAIGFTHMWKHCKYIIYIIGAKPLYITPTWHISWNAVAPILISVFICGPFTYSNTLICTQNLPIQQCEIPEQHFTTTRCAPVSQCYRTRSLTAVQCLTSVMT